MGIMSFIKGGVAEMAIARPDAAKDQWVYKHPDQTIPWKAQLTVDSDEIALFFKNGAYVGQFSAGRHTLDANNIPFLGQLIDKFTGGNVFLCEVFFVTTREMPSIKFGTSIGDVQDPQTKLRIRLMVHGEFSAKVIDAVKLLIGLVGQKNATNEGFLPWFKSQVQKTMKDGIAELIVKENWPLMKVTSGGYTDEIEESTLQKVRRNIEPYGVEIIRLGDFSISMDEKDKERWIGKVIKPGPAVTEIDDIQRNILSILRRVAPNARIPQSAVKIFVLQGANASSQVIDDGLEGDEAEEGSGPYITY